MINYLGSTLVSVNISWFKFGLTRGLHALDASPFCIGGNIRISSFFARREGDVEKEEKEKTGESRCVGAKHPGQVTSFYCPGADCVFNLT